MVADSSARRDPVTAERQLASYRTNRDSDCGQFASADIHWEWEDLGLVFFFLYGHEILYMIILDIYSSHCMIIVTFEQFIHAHTPSSISQFDLLRV